ncbi:MAG: PAS domain S-box protein [Phycisphaerae bacterium]|nr:PAS domain S-box protein [Phycisphaerae bacterium]
MDTLEPRAVAQAKLLSRVIAMLTMLAGIAVLVGWALGFEPLKRVLGGTGVMKPWTAVSFFCAAASLLFVHRHARSDAADSSPADVGLHQHREGSPGRLWVKLLAAIPFGVGSLTLLEYATGAEIGLDALFFPNAVVETNLPWPGRMTPAAATGFCGLGLALLFLEVRIARAMLPQIFAFVPAATGLVGFLGYIYGVDSLLRVPAYSSMALHTSILFLATSFAVVLAKPGVGLTAPLMSRFNGGVMARRVLPFAIVVPFILGWLRLWGEQAGLYDTPFGLAVFASSNIAVFTILVWISAVRINRLDGAREVASERLALSEARSRAINEHAADLILTLDRGGRIRFANPAVRELLGIGDTAAAEARLVDFIDPDDRGSFARAINAATRHGAAIPAAFDLRLRGAHGENRIFEALARNLFDNPHVEAILLNARDVTERRAAARSLRESESRLATIFHDTPFPMALVRQSDLRFVDANEPYLGLLGYARTELIGQRPEDVGLLVDARGEALAAQVRQGALLQGVELVLRTKAGELRHVIASACVIQMDGVPHTFSILFDITETRMAEAERQAREARLAEHARQSQRLQALGTLAGGIAHDFNNLLAVISGNLQLIGHERNDATIEARSESAVTSRCLDEMRRATERAIDLTKRILAFSRRPEGPPGQGSSAPIQLREAVAEAVALLRSTLPASVELKTSLEAEVSPVAIDPTSVQQIILNLGTNAAHAIGDAAGIIEIRIEPVEIDRAMARAVPGLTEGPRVLLSVRDSGCGIDAATLPHVFEPFFTTKPAGQGTGLGLSVVHGVVTSLGGTVAVESRAGEGTTVRMYLPAAAETGRATTDKPLPPLATAGQRVMYVDDEEALVWLTTRLLERRGYRVTSFSDPAKALTAFRTDPMGFDVIVTDGSMPGMTGQQFAERVRQVRPEIPILLTSGFLTPDRVEEAKRCGVRDVLLKPSTVEELEQAIHAALSVAATTNADS